MREVFRLLQRVEDMIYEIYFERKYIDYNSYKEIKALLDKVWILSAKGDLGKHE